MEFLNSLWAYLLVSAPYLMVGLTLAGLFHEFVPMSKVKKWLGGKSFMSVVRAAVVGIPLPLCSCSVIPSAVEIKKSGANNGSTSAFLIATPESGIDSISLTYALIDLPMAIIRPVAAFFSAFFAGALQLMFNNEDQKIEEEVKSCCSKKKKEEPEIKSCCASKKEVKKESRVIKAISYGFGDLVNDIAKWLTIGILAGALIDYVVPADFFLQYSQNAGRFLILLVGIPLYICATASTPIAVSLMLKGLSPGSALVLLLVGPATNISNIAVLQKYIGKKGVIINMFSIAFVALIFSYITDWLYGSFVTLKLNEQLAHHDHGGTWWEILSAIVLIILLIKGLWIEEIKPHFNKQKVQSCH
jgi:uncharacterized membrane protein YraQ (UPF0718 family)